MPANRTPEYRAAEASFHGLGELGPWLFAHLGIVRVLHHAAGPPA
jgi:hypothetical protein